ncbi:MAG: helix-turn-helix domain-containing protein [Clostridiales bacterium]|nr:helix-turn-helix domain-containing protein [Clostridiales bacterium]
MKSFYERHRELDTLPYVLRSQAYDFPAHFHGNLEVLIVKRGEKTMHINGEEYCADNDTVTVIDSYDVHAYETKWNEDCRVVIIPQEAAAAFHARHKNLRIKDKLIKDAALCDELLKIVDEYLLQDKSESVQAVALELFLATLNDKIEWIEERGGGEVELIRKMLAFIHENYREDVSRKTLARVLGYAEAHISRVFHRYLKTGISAYVNGLRLAYVEKRKKDGDTTVTELIYEAGFKSQQTYYRVKKMHNA